MWIVDRPGLAVLGLVVISCIALAGHNYQTLVAQGFLQQALNNEVDRDNSDSAEDFAAVPDVG